MTKDKKFLIVAFFHIIIALISSRVLADSTQPQNLNEATSQNQSVKKLGLSFLKFDYDQVQSLSQSTIQVNGSVKTSLKGSLDLYLKGGITGVIIQADDKTRQLNLLEAQAGVEYGIFLMGFSYLHSTGPSDYGFNHLSGPEVGIHLTSHFINQWEIYLNLNTAVYFNSGSGLSFNNTKNTLELGFQPSQSVWSYFLAASQFVYEEENNKKCTARWLEGGLYYRF